MLNMSYNTKQKFSKKTFLHLVIKEIEQNLTTLYSCRISTTNFDNNKEEEEEEEALFAL